MNDLYKKSSVGPRVSGYPAASPPLYYIDDVKTPIGCYNQHHAFDDDGFDWSDILDKSDGGHGMADIQTSNIIFFMYLLETHRVVLISMYVLFTRERDIKVRSPLGSYKRP